MLTTNLPFSDWPTIFPNAGSAIALIDRLVHHAEIITIDGDSYRRRVAEAKRKPLAAGSGELKWQPVQISALSHVAQHLGDGSRHDQRGQCGLAANRPRGAM